MWKTACLALSSLDTTCMDVAIMRQCVRQAPARGASARSADKCGLFAAAHAGADSFLSYAVVGSRRGLYRALILGLRRVACRPWGSATTRSMETKASKRWTETLRPDEEIQRTLVGRTCPRL